MAKKLKDETPKVAEKNENPFANISSVIRDLNNHYGKKNNPNRRGYSCYT